MISYTTLIVIQMSQRLRRWLNRFVSLFSSERTPNKLDNDAAVPATAALPDDTADEAAAVPDDSLPGMEAERAVVLNILDIFVSSFASTSS